MLCDECGVCSVTLCARWVWSEWGQRLRPGQMQYLERVLGVMQSLEDFLAVFDRFLLLNSTARDEKLNPNAVLLLHIRSLCLAIHSMEFSDVCELYERLLVWLRGEEAEKPSPQRQIEGTSERYLAALAERDIERMKVSTRSPSFLFTRLQECGGVEDGFAEQSLRLGVGLKEMGLTDEGNRVWREGLHLAAEQQQHALVRALPEMGEAQKVQPRPSTRGGPPNRGQLERLLQSDDAAVLHEGALTAHSLGLFDLRDEFIAKLFTKN